MDYQKANELPTHSWCYNKNENRTFVLIDKNWQVAEVDTVEILELHKTQTTGNNIFKLIKAKN